MKFSQILGSFLHLLGIVFLILKGTGAISWSWWWVLLPLYAPWALLLVVAVIGGFVWMLS